MQVIISFVSTHFMMPSEVKKPKLLSRVGSLLFKDRSRNDPAGEHSQNSPKQSILRGAHDFHMSNFLMINAPNATQINAINEAEMQHIADNVGM